MIRRGTPPRITIAQLGPLARPQVENALGLANLIQRGFHFDFHPVTFPLADSEYLLPNGSYDLDAAALAVLNSQQVPRPVVFLTSAPYGEPSTGTQPDYFFFAEYELRSAQSASIVSTHLWSSLPGKQPLQPYVFLTLAGVALTVFAGLQMHEETRGCVFDYCDEPADMATALSVGSLCLECERHVSSAVRSGQLSVEQLAAARQLINRAVSRRLAFVLMPFTKPMDPVFRVIQHALTQAKWDVVRADHISHPRRITDAIVCAILTADLVVADLTGNNPNVFYELGISHAAGCDVVLLTQQKSLPFDVTTDRAVLYDASPKGLRRLGSELRALAGAS